MKIVPFSVQVGMYEIERPVEVKERQWPQLVAILLGCLTSLNTGLSFAWTSPAIPAIISDKKSYDIDLEEASYFTVIPSIMLSLGSLVFIKLIDVIGRKYTVLFMVVPQLVSWFLISMAHNKWVFYAARVATGLSDACLFASLPVYIAEIATPKVRGTWGNSMTFTIYLGETMINVIGKYLNVRQSAYVCSAIPVIFGCTFIFMPESPYYLIMKGRTEDARIALQRLRGVKNVDNELATLTRDVNRQISESGTWKDLFMIRSNRKALMSGVFLRASQQFAGVTTFAVYTQYIFQQSGTSMDAATAAIIFTGLSAIVNAIAGYTLDKIGRKRSYLLSLLACGFLLLIEAIYFILNKEFGDKVDLENWRWVPVTGMLLYVVTFSLGVGIAPTLMLGELFSASVKTKGLCLLSLLCGILVAFVTKLFQVLETQVGLYAPFIFFSVSCFVCAVMALCLVPETSGKTLEEIQQDYKNEKS